MKTITQYLLVFVVGLLIGVSVWNYRGRLSERHHREALRVALFANSQMTWQEYFVDGKAPIPIPRQLDFTTNAWRRLAYWIGFARGYVATHESDLHPHYRGIATGIAPTDPHWVEWVDEETGGHLGAQAKQMNITGTAYDDIVRWVTENYKYPEEPPKPRFDK